VPPWCGCRPVRVARDDLLGGEVADGPDEHARLGLLARRLSAREAEVGHLDAAVGVQQDVLGLDVAVDQPGAVRGSQRGEHRLHDLQRLARTEPAALGEQGAQGASRDVLHRQEHVALAGALVVHGDHARVRQRRSVLGLADEASYELLVAHEVRVHDLQGHRALELGVMADVHRRHAALGDPRLDAVAPVEHLPDEWVRNRRIHQRECIRVQTSYSSLGHRKASILDRIEINPPS
jgi:hypothetical protein